MRICSALYRGERDAPRIKLGGVRLVLRSREDIDLLAPADVYEPRVLQHPFPLCFQQSTGYSAAPEIDIVLRVLRDRLVDDDVSDLDPSAGFQHTVDLLHHHHLVGTEVDDAVTDHDID